MNQLNKVIIVTGASAGIGRATAVALVQAGASVIITARRMDRLTALTAQMAAYPGQCYPLNGDIRDESFAKTVVEETVATFGRLDVLINNAGIGHRSNISELPAADIRTVWDTNVLGLLYTIQAALPQMKQQGHGQIINVSSIVGQRPLPYSAIYCASKTAVNFLSRSLRMELRPYNIKVTLVYPGLTATEFAEARLGQEGINRLGLKGVPPERVASKIMAGIRNGRSEIYITPTDWLFVHINRLFPRFTDWIVTRSMHLA